MSGVSTLLHKVPVIGGLFNDDAADAKLKMLHEMAVAYQAQRPELAQGQTNALNQTLQAYAPANNMLGAMYGPGAMQILEALGQNPMTPGTFTAGGVGATAKLQADVNKRKDQAGLPYAPAPTGKAV